MEFIYELSGILTEAILDYNIQDCIYVKVNIYVYEFIAVLYINI